MPMLSQAQAKQSARWCAAGWYAAVALHDAKNAMARRPPRRPAQSTSQTMLDNLLLTMLAWHTRVRHAASGACVHTKCFDLLIDASERAVFGQRRFARQHFAQRNTQPRNSRGSNCSQQSNGSYSVQRAAHSRRDCDGWRDVGRPVHSSVHRCSQYMHATPTSSSLSSRACPRPSQIAARSAKTTLRRHHHAHSDARCVRIARRRDANTKHFEMELVRKWSWCERQTTKHT